jgi:hypothetical protein
MELLHFKIEIYSLNVLKITKKRLEKELVNESTQNGLSVEASGRQTTTTNMG